MTLPTEVKAPQTKTYSVDNQVLTAAERDIVKTESKQVFKKKKSNAHTTLPMRFAQNASAPSLHG